MVHCQGWEASPTLDLDGNIEKQGGEGGGAGLQPHPNPEDLEEPPLTPPSQPTVVMSTYSHENEIDMQEGAVGVKRGRNGQEENYNAGKWRKREGIKQGLQDTLACEL